MSFIDAAQEASFAGLLTYAVIVVAAHLFNWQKFCQLRLLGVFVGCVLGIGAGAQLQLTGFPRYALMGLFVGVFSYLFGVLKARFPQHAA